MYTNTKNTAKFFKLKKNQQRHNFYGWEWNSNTIFPSIYVIAIPLANQKEIEGSELPLTLAGPRTGKETRLEKELGFLEGLQMRDNEGATGVASA